MGGVDTNFLLEAGYVYDGEYDRNGFFTRAKQLKEQRIPFRYERLRKVGYLGKEQLYYVIFRDSKNQQQVRAQG